MKDAVLFLFLVVLFSACSAPKEATIPWANLSWLEQTNLHITIENSQQEQVEISVLYFNNSTRESFKKELSLKENQSEKITFNLFRPELIRVRYQEKEEKFYVIPNKDIEIELSDKLSFKGENAAIYTTLKEIGDHDLKETEFKELLNTKALPEWLEEYLVKSRSIKEVYRIYQTAGYQQFSGFPEVVVPTKDSIKAELLIKEEKEGLYHNYYAQLKLFKTNFEFIKANESLPVELENYAKRKNLFEAVLKSKEEKISNDLLAMYVEGSLIRKRKSFKFKDKILNFAISQLPEAYVLRLNEIEGEYTNQNYELQEVVNLLQKNLEYINGAPKAPLEGKQHFKLLKFWFAGCAPCKKQIPYENALQEQFENLDIIHFCYSTDAEQWKAYVKENNPLGTHHFLDRETYKTYKSVFSLGYAPRYVLLNPANEIVCWECGNPSNKELDSVLAKE